MRDLKILTGLVYFCVAGVVVSFGGGIYTAVSESREAAKPHVSVFPVPAGSQQDSPATQQRVGGGLPTPAQ